MGGEVKSLTGVRYGRVGDRQWGKTYRALERTLLLARSHPDKQVIFVTHSPQFKSYCRNLLGDISLPEGAPGNVVFLSLREVLRRTCGGNIAGFEIDHYASEHDPIAAHEAWQALVPRVVR